MASELHMLDDEGDLIQFSTVGRAPGVVDVTFYQDDDVIAMRLSGERKDDFAKLWMEACRRADGEPPAAEASDA